MSVQVWIWVLHLQLHCLFCKEKVVSYGMVGISVTLVLLVHKHVRISVAKWILEITLPYKHVTILYISFL